MPHYIAIVDDEDPDKAVGIWFPDLTGCFSGGDDLDEALKNAPEAIDLYARSLAAEGRSSPRALSLAELRLDPDAARNMKGDVIALITSPVHADAAE
jgi:predicted RNase H-like HicB family nuclease